MIQNSMPQKWLAEWIDPEPAHDGKERRPASVLRKYFTADLSRQPVDGPKLDTNADAKTNTKYGADSDTKTDTKVNTEFDTTSDT